MIPADYIMNNMKSFFHHSRNKKLEKSFNPLQLRYIVAIYNTFIKNNKDERTFCTEDSIKEVNKYIFSHIRTIRGDIKEIPDALKI